VSSLTGYQKSIHNVSIGTQQGTYSDVEITMKRTYLVTLADRESGKDQRILVQSECSDGMQEFVDTLSDLTINNPVVINVAELPIKRPLPKTNLASFTA